jgi:5-methylthioadenosine/S-adenosylhomocysteine deaminase
MSELMIAGRIATMAQGAAEEPAPGRVWIRDGAVVAVTSPKKRIGGFRTAPELDVGDAFVLPGFIDMHNH